MKRFITLLVCFALALSVMFLFSNKTLTEHERLMQSPAYRLSQQYQNKEGLENQEEKDAEGAINYLNRIRANQVTGRIDFADVYNARQQARQNAQTNKRSATLNLQWEDLGPDNVGGRTRALMIDRNNPDHMLAGGVAGGVFVSNNGGLSWSEHGITQYMEHVGVSTIKQASNGDIYIGTGESFAVALNGVPQSLGAPGFVGDGIYKLNENNGISYEHLSSTIPTTNRQTEGWAYVNEIAIDPNDAQKIYAATQGGLKISDDGGETWVNPTGITNNQYASEVAMGNDGVVYAAVSSKYFRSENGVDFTNMTGVGGFPANNIGIMEIVVSPQDPKYVYAVISKSGFSGELNSVQRSTDAGLTWTALIPSSSETFDVLGNQGTWNIALGVDPLNKERIFVGGQIQLWLYDNGGWTQVAAAFPDSPENPYYVHADMHGIVFHPTDNNIMFVISDGGIFKSYNATQQFPTFTMRNKGYNVTQFYGACASDFGYVMGGAQDNGTQLVTRHGNTKLSASEVKGGDGGDCEFSSINPQVLFASSYGGNYVRSSSLGSSFGTFFDNNVDYIKDGAMDNPSLFVGTSFLWERDESYQTQSGDTTINVEIKKSVYFAAGNNQLWFTPGALNLSTQPYWYDVSVSGEVSEIEVAPDGTIFCGTTLGYVYRIDGLNNKFKPVTTVSDSTHKEIKYVPDFPQPSNPHWVWPFSSATATIQYQGITRTNIGNFGTSRFVTGIAADPRDHTHVVVTLGNYGNQNYVYQSTLGGPFVSIQNNLPQWPVYDAVIDYYNPNNIILGTEQGIWTSTDQGDSWNEENEGMARTICMKLFQRKLHDSDCMVLYAGTHGRGTFRSTSITKSGCNLEPGDLPIGIADISNIKELQVYPNPVYDKAIVEFELKEQNAPVTLLVMDLLGGIIKNEKLNNLNSGHNKMEVSFDNVSGGVYMLVLKTGKGSESKRVIVTK